MTNEKPTTLKEMSSQRYWYSFQAWPDSHNNFPTAMFTLFELLGGRRVEEEFAEFEFEAFRRDLLGCGITLREIERVPKAEPEPIV